MSAATPSLMTAAIVPKQIQKQQHLSQSQAPIPATMWAIYFATTVCIYANAAEAVLTLSSAVTHHQQQ